MPSPSASSTRRSRGTAVTKAAPPKPLPSRLSPRAARTAPIADLAAFYLACKDAYEHTDAPLVDDATFDALESVLVDRAPQHPALRVVGAHSHAGVPLKKVSLPYWMGSQDKVYPTDTSKFERWSRRFPSETPCVASVKLDGLSAILRVTASSVALWSRGTGREASDWSHHLPYMHRLHAPIERLQTWLRGPGAATPQVVLRGEAIMSLARYEAHRFARGWTSTPRNVVSGLLNSKTSARHAVGWIDVVVYEVVEPRGMPAEAQLQWLDARTGASTFLTVANALGAACNARRLPPAFDLADLEPLFWTFREASPYATDGVVVAANLSYARITKGNPTYSFAFKIRVDDASQAAVTVVRDVLWQVSRTKLLKPTILLEPVLVGGVTIQRATGYNYRFIADHKVGAGARVEVRRCGDVIPNVTKILRPAVRASQPAPHPYTLTPTGVDAVATDPEQWGAGTDYRAKTLTHFFKHIGVTQADEKTFQRCVEAGADDPFAVLALEAPSVREWEGMGEKSAQHLVEDLRRRALAATARQWVVAGGVFGPGFSERKLAAVEAGLPALFAVVPLNATRRATLRADLLAVRGVHAKTADRLLDHLPAYLKFWRQVEAYCERHGRRAPAWPTATHAAPPQASASTPLHDRIFCFTGFRDAPLQARIEVLGGSVSSAWTQSVNVLVRANDTSTGAKYHKALQKQAAKGPETVVVLTHKTCAQRVAAVEKGRSWRDDA